MRGAFYNLINFLNTAELNDVYSNAAKIILENISKIPELTITDVANLCFVSTATISRLCRKLNYESFADFKSDVTMNLRYFNRDSIRMQFDHQLPVFPVQGKTTKELFVDHFENIIDNLRATYNTIKFEKLEDIVDRIYQSQEVCFAGNFFTQSVSMQLQIELAYLGKRCSAMYPLNSQKEVVKQLSENDVIIVSSIAGGYWIDHPDMMREISKSKAYKICITQVENFPYNEYFDMSVKVGTDHLSLIGKFSITYIFEVLEALYHVKYANDCKKKQRWEHRYFLFRTV